MIRFSIIIISYNSERHIKKCLDSILKQDFFGYEIILVDNASGDRTREIINEYKTRIRIKNNDENTGFPEAVNIGIAMSGGEYILTLNPDVILSGNFLSEASKRINKLDKKVGMLGVKMLRTDSENIIDSTGLILTKSFRFFDRGSGEKDSGQYDKDVAILGPCAAAGIYKRDMLEDIKTAGGYFDKDFFYLIEDFDIALRAGRKGWKALYLPEAVCYHLRNGSDMNNEYRQYLSFRNRYFLMIKNIKIDARFLFYFAVYDIPRLFFMFLKNKYTAKALKETWRSLPGLLKKRKYIINDIQKDI